MTPPEGENRNQQALRLARRFVDVQGIDEADAATVAQKIATCDEDIWSAALRWLDEGSLPDTPEIEGYSPKWLGTRFPASVALTALMALRRDPERARSFLRYHPAISIGGGQGEPPSTRG